MHQDDIEGLLTSVTEKTQQNAVDVSQSPLCIAYINTLCNVGPDDNAIVFQIFRRLPVMESRFVLLFFVHGSPLVCERSAM